ncbi:tRNA (cytidine(56)-2'-O)-methyltransferase [Candidatus Woesearchaeota archaeon]|nr:tRNA (cytidine(56)-2'-O)-methyltransferase [Candidatus Woesearchaeota archaeon]
MIEVLRLSHRIGRDPRLSTHVILTARAFGAEKVYYSGDHDKSLEDSTDKIVSNFGGPFEIEYVKNPLKLIDDKKKKGFQIVHLTMYGKNFEKLKLKKKVLVVVGSEKVEKEFYEICENISVGNQPHSEVAALGVLLYKFFGVKKKFMNPKIIIEGLEKGKKITKI